MICGKKHLKERKLIKSNGDMEILSVKQVKHLGAYVMLCTFSTGVVKEVDLSPLLDYPAFKELKDESQFKQFGLDGTIFWANGADIAPEWLYDNGKEVKQ